MIDSVADFSLGDTITGTNDNSVLINSALEGREYTFPVTADVAAAAGMSNRAVGRRVVARIVRNTSGAVLAAGEIVTMDFTTGHAGLGSATTKSAADDRCCLVVDPALGSSTVADDDLFYAIVKGPTKVKQPASAATLVGGDVIVAGDAGRLALGAIATDHGIVLGTVLKSNAVNDALVEVELAPEWV
tara:strand:+ start:3619 stop:4182 length:564 start_codon:yes stop_codon:yes gene_type:complete